MKPFKFRLNLGRTYYRTLIFNNNIKLRKMDTTENAFAIKKYVTYYGYTDRHAWEVIKIISDKTVQIRRLTTKLIKAPVEFYPGGFSGHYADNYNQEYEYTSNPNNATQQIRLGKHGWGLGKFGMSDKPHEFYDYNF